MSLEAPAAMRRELLAGGFFFSLLLLALAFPSDAAPSGADFAKVRDNYVKVFLRRFPVVATYLGADGLDPLLASVNGTLRDYSAPALENERKEWVRFQNELARSKRSAASEADRIDAEVMAAQLAFLLRNLDRKIHQRAIDVYLEEPLRGVEWSLQGMSPVAGSKIGTRAEWETLIQRVEAVPNYLRTALSNLEHGVPDRRMIQVSLKAAQTTADYFDQTLPKRAKDEMPESGGASVQTLSAASKRAAAAFRDFRKGLLRIYFQDDGKKLKPQFDRDHYASGAAEYEWALKNNLRVSWKPRELHAYGKKKVAETQEKITALAKRIAKTEEMLDGSVPAVLAALSDQAAHSDAELLGWYKEDIQRLVEYARKTKLFNVPDDYHLDVIFTPPPLRDTIDAAYYPAPPFKQSGTGQFYVTPTGDDPVKLRSHPRASIADLSAHEGFPGHDWQYQFLRTRAKSISPVRWLTPGGVEDSASMWEDSMSSEGWALYSEQLVGEPRPRFPEGFYSPEEHLFQLKAQLLRDARVVVDTGIHCGYMTFDQAVEYFARNVHFVKGAVSTDPAKNPSSVERAAVESSQKAMYRYSKWPTQAITYHLGKSEILSLREQVRKIEGPKFDERRFHEELLSQGTIPTGYVRETLLGAARSRAGQPQ